MQDLGDRRRGHRSRSLTGTPPKGGPRVRRAASLFFRLDEGGPLDVASLLRGRLEIGPESRVLAVSVLTGAETVLTREELDGLLRISERRWTSKGEHDPSLVDALARRALVVTDEDDPALRAFRERDERMAAGAWQPYAALFHSVTRWRNETVDTYAEVAQGETTHAVDALFAEVGPPPPHFHEVEGAVSVHRLPLPTDGGPLYDVLAARRTTRAYDPRASLTEQQLSTVLHAVFGCHGTTPLHGPHLALKKTSPSGGALHPIEAYPLVVGVEGQRSGLHHYRPRDHALELIEPLDPAAGRELANHFMCAQPALADAQVHVVLTARFSRSFWKYRRHDKAYQALLMEAGHLSQTLYLVATELGLGAFVTAAINGADVDERLGLDATVESALAICGCGVPSGKPSPLEPEFEPYVPPR